MIKTLFHTLAAAILVSASLTVHGEDIDIFMNNPSLPATHPNVLILLDNTANWNTPFNYEKAALVSLVNGLDSRFNVGLMFFTETGSGNTGSDGAYIRAGIRNMTSTNKTALSNLVNSVDKLNDKSNGGKLGLTMYEAYLYFKGGTAYAGATKVKRDYAGNTVSGYPASNAVYALPGNALASSSSTAYTSPLNNTNNCAKNFIIYISNGPAQDNSSDITAATSYLSSAGGNTTTIPINPSGSQDNVADEWTRFLFNNDLRSDLSAKQNIVTYTVDVNPGTTGQGPGWTALLGSMATQGGGKKFTASDSATLVKALTDIFNEIQAVDSVFASVALPVTVNVRGSYLNQVYMGVFRPDQYAAPRWPGNLKQYKVAYDPINFSFFLADKNGNKIEDSSTGFVVPGAVSFWTTDSTFWEFNPSGTPPSISDSPDGSIVEKGAAGERLRTTYATSQTARNLYTCTGSCTTNSLLSATPFSTSNTDITDGDLGLSSAFTPTLITLSGSTATVTTALAHGLSNGTTVNVSGATQSAYNGAFAISNVTANTFDYTVVVTPVTPDTGSTITANGGGATTFTLSSLSNGATSGTRDIVTAVTSVSHGYSTGSIIPNVTIAGAAAKFNGTFNITIINATTFTYTLTVNPLPSKGTNGWLAGSTASVPIVPKAVTALTRSGTTATATVTAHGYSTGNLITIAGATGSEYNGNFIITWLTADTFTYTITLGPTSPAIGTITIKTGSTDRDTLINWVRGQDNAVDENGDSSMTDVRASIYGDVLHSNPAVVNYARTTDQRDIVIYHGGNDGALHAVKGGRDDADGVEKWSVIFSELFPKLDRLRSNAPAISTSTPKPYFVDGPISAYFKDVNSDGKLVATDGDKAYIYATMRRGGRFLYALDVSNPDTPKFLWKKDTTSAGFGELGQTWSEAKTGRVNLTAGETPVVIFGAGYDATAEDALPATADSMGRGIFIVNAETGALLKSFVHTASNGIDYAIPSGITIVDRNSDGYLDRLYVGDTGGKLWRVDMADPDPTNWSIHLIASISGSGNANKRKFLGSPSVVFGTSYDSILLGSGDREHPFDTTVVNRFYMFKDPNTGFTGGNLNLTEADLYDATANLIQDGTSAQATAAQDALNNADGWYITLDTGEKVVGSAVTILGTTFFGTNTPTPPDPATCSSNLGEARFYAVNFENGASTIEQDSTVGLSKGDRSVTIAGGGLLPSPVAVQVKADTGQTLTGPITGTHIFTAPGAGRRSRVYWFQNLDN
jgi:Tfp pilus tip-associated adhesin PilY1